MNQDTLKSIDNHFHSVRQSEFDWWNPNHKEGGNVEKWTNVEEQYGWPAGRFSRLMNTDILKIFIHFKEKSNEF